MATYIFALNSETRVYGDYLYQAAYDSSYNPWQNTEKQLGQWNSGEYSRPAGDSILIGRYAVNSTSAYVLRFVFPTSKQHDGVSYVWLAALFTRVTSSATTEVVQVLESYDVIFTTSASTEYCLIPVYVAKACSIVFDGNGGTPASQTISFRSGNTVTLPQSPTRDGFVFNGWKIGDDVYDAGSSVRLFSDSNAIAQWSESPTPPPGPRSGLLAMIPNSGALAFSSTSGFLVYN